jgi:hypothetical protein
MARREYRTIRYRAFKRMLAETEIPCWWCGIRRAVSPDHNPPVSLGGTDADLVGACLKCQYSRGGQLSGALKRARKRERRTLLHPWDGP